MTGMLLLGCFDTHAELNPYCSKFLAALVLVMSDLMNSTN